MGFQPWRAFVRKSAVVLNSGAIEQRALRRRPAYIPGILLLALAFLAGCQGPQVDPPAVEDADGDGYTVLDGDCNDHNADISPAGVESCNGLDDNCDGKLDEGVQVTFYEDNDQDGFGSNVSTALSCEGAAGYVPNNRDCNDESPYINPTAIEVCDGIDNNCDSVIDTDAADRKTFFVDTDSDGYGAAADVSTPLKACSIPAKGYSNNADDCNDLAASIHPGTVESCDYTDNNCDGESDEGFDRDGDGVPDCQAAEVCDGLDNNGDGKIDEGFDKDNDGFTPADCDCKTNDSRCGSDCDDNKKSVNPTASELCDTIDNNCNGAIDEDTALDVKSWYVDKDGDGYGSPDLTKTVKACAQPKGYVNNGQDCDDTDPQRSPGLEEYCDQKDNNCNGVIDEDLTYRLFYLDGDGDGFGTSTTSTKDCAPPSGFVADATDCDDTNAKVNPKATELCNAIDDNCNTEIDENTAADVKTWYEDKDDDTFGNRDVHVDQCYQPTGFVATPVSEIYYDCDDTNPTSFPNADELCDKLDNNCNGKIDDNVGYYLFYPDLDADKYGDYTQEAILSCSIPADGKTYAKVSDGGDIKCTDYCTAEECGDPENGVPSTCYIYYQYNSGPKDCNDKDPKVNPAATEKCDGIDNDCDATIDEASASDAQQWYIDADHDGYGVFTETPYVACPAQPPPGYTDPLPPAGYVGNSLDCNDAKPAISPAATETCDGIDNNCNSQVDENSSSGAATWYQDTDGDGYGNQFIKFIACYKPSGYVANGLDCDDTKNAVNPVATESCNTIDDNCDGRIDETTSSDSKTWYVDSDSDGYGNASFKVVQCYQPSGYVLDNTDCNDGSAGTNPGKTEICDTKSTDENCNGKADDTDSTTDANTKTRYYPDLDLDGHGDKTESSTLYCHPPDAKWSILKDDCNDARADVYPGAKEICDSNNVDEDCNGLADNNDSGADPTTKTRYYQDTDKDGYGDGGSVGTLYCDDPTIPSLAWTTDHTDCNDKNIAVNPSATEVCDPASVDENCNGKADDQDSGTLSSSKTRYYPDVDQDGYGDASNSGSLYCHNPSTSSLYYTTNHTDCSDTDATSNPGYTEICGDGKDNNCNGQVDEASSANAATFYQDADGDSYGNIKVTQKACSAPSGYVNNATDCDDTKSGINPGATEICDTNSVDENCNGKADDNDPTLDTSTRSTTYYPDADKDGFGSKISAGSKYCHNPSTSSVLFTADNTDCDDTKYAINPNATEVCDGFDNNCNGVIDEASASDAITWYRDADSDTFGTSSTANSGDTQKKCTQPSGYVATNKDCDDTNAAIKPGANEVCDSKDNNCDGFIDEATAVDATSFYQDADTDTYGNPNKVQNKCGSSPPSGYVTNNSDCDDTNKNIKPGATETCDGVDNNCNGQTDEGNNGQGSTWYKDADADGHGDPTQSKAACAQPNGYVQKSDDCDDTDAKKNPDQPEVCGDGKDNNCDTKIDDSTSVDAKVWYPDADSDTYGSAAVTAVTKTACTQPAGYVLEHTDCDDSKVAVNPAATEICDTSHAVDENCNTKIDDSDPTTSAASKSTWYPDVDTDTFGAKSANASTTPPTVLACAKPSGYVADHTDCDDGAIAVKPGATETCNGVDDDCDSVIDDGLSTTTYYQDADGDTYGTTKLTKTACSKPSGFSTVSTDCNDTDATIFPGATETCNGKDDDCDTVIDNGVLNTYYADADADTYGTTAVTTKACSKPTGYSTLSTDCDDASASVHPGATETCNGIDDNCTSGIDEGFTKSTFYQDADADTFGTTKVTTQACTKPSGYSAVSTDCNDTDATIFPGATETCNGKDDDCDTTVDDGVLTTFYVDADSDTFGSSAVSTTACSKPTGYSTLSTDCNDTDATIHPGATETCNAKDDNCTGGIDEGLATVTYYQDADSDTYGNASSTKTFCTTVSGYVTNSTDCDDTNSAINTAATEVCDGKDNNCSGVIDEGVKITFYKDADSDTYGNAAVTTSACTAPSTYVANSTDCNDSSATIFPGATDYCSDGIEQDCNANGACTLSLTGTPAGLDVRASGAAAGHATGASVASAGDVNGDGYEDLLVGAPGSAKGTVFLIYGSPTITGSSLKSIDLAAPTGTTVFQGESTGDAAGASVAGIGDVDRDGYDDIAIGAPHYEITLLTIVTHPGAVYIIKGKPAGFSTAAPVSLSTADLVIYGHADNDKFGASVAAAGDVDRDGRVDTLIGAPNVQSSGGKAIGKGYLLLSKNLPVLPLSEINTLTTSSYTVGASSDDEMIGASVASAGDINKDGRADFLFGAPGAKNSGNVTGNAYLFLGSASPGASITPTYTLKGEAALDAAGAAVSTAGDVNHDGKEDFLVGAKGASGKGRVYLVSYPNLVANSSSGAFSLAAADYILTGEATGDDAGASVAPAGDVNLDGFADFLVGAPKHVNSSKKGTVYLIYGSASLINATAPVTVTASLSTFSAAFYGEQAASAAGASVASCDINGDFQDDIVIGDPEYKPSTLTGAGGAYVVLGTMK